MLLASVNRIVTILTVFKQVSRTRLLLAEQTQSHSLFFCLDTTDLNTTSLRKLSHPAAFLNVYISKFTQLCGIQMEEWKQQ